MIIWYGKHAVSIYKHTKYDQHSKRGFRKKWTKCHFCWMSLKPHKYLFFCKNHSKADLHKLEKTLRHVINISCMH